MVHNLQVSLQPQAISDTICGKTMIQVTLLERLRENGIEIMDEGDGFTAVKGGSVNRLDAEDYESAVYEAASLFDVAY